MRSVRMPEGECCVRSTPKLWSCGTASLIQYIPVVFWLVFDTTRGRCLVLQPASSLIHARLVAAVNNLEAGQFVEGHLLERKYLRKVPKHMIGKCLSPRQSEKLLEKRCVLLRQPIKVFLGRFNQPLAPLRFETALAK